MSRDRLVGGNISTAARKKMLEQEDLTFESAFKIALSMEMAEKQSAQMDQILHPQSQQVVYKVKKDIGQKLVCWCCGSSSHTAFDCPCKHMTCYNCKEIGHLSRKCIYNKEFQIRKDILVLKILRVNLRQKSTVFNK